MDFLTQLLPKWLGIGATAIGTTAFTFYALFKGDSGFNFIKKLALFALTTGAMTALGFFFDSGALVNEIAQFFTYIKSFMFLFDFVVPVDIMFYYIGLLMKFFAFYWSILGILFVVKFFKD